VFSWLDHGQPRNRRYSRLGARRKAETERHAAARIRRRLCSYNARGQAFVRNTVAVVAACVLTVAPRPHAAARPGESIDTSSRQPADLDCVGQSANRSAHRRPIRRTDGGQPSQPTASCFSCAVIALRMNIATVTGPTPPGTGVTQLATSLTSSVSTSPTIIVSPLGPVT
jgi:hypothetical protein